MTWHEPQIVLSIVGVAIAFLYTILTGFIRYATSQNTKATREVLEASHRPYVGVTGAELQGDVMGVPPSIAISIANVGTVPSRKVKIDIEMRVGTSIRTISGAGTPIAILPGHSFPATFAMTEDEFRYLQTSFELTIEVRYQGMTDKQYATQCTCSYSGPLHSFSMTAGSFN